MEIYNFSIAPAAGAALAPTDIIVVTIAGSPQFNSTICTSYGQAVTVNFASGSSVVNRTVNSSSQIVCILSKTVTPSDVAAGRLPGYNVTVTYQVSSTANATSLTVTPVSFQGVPVYQRGKLPLSLGYPAAAVDINNSPNNSWTNSSGGWYGSAHIPLPGPDGLTFLWTENCVKQQAWRHMSDSVPSWMAHSQH